jgi:hypothetical protein
VQAWSREEEESGRETEEKSRRKVDKVSSVVPRGKRSGSRRISATQLGST